jgi:hypothetical protein
MAKKRTALEQVKSGFRIAGTIVLAFIFFVALWGSIRFLTLRNNIENQGAHPLLGGLSLLLLSGILLLTTKTWSRWLFVILAYCTARLFFGVWFIAFGIKPRVDPKTAFLTILNSYPFRIGHREIREACSAGSGTPGVGSVFGLPDLCCRIPILGALGCGSCHTGRRARNSLLHAHEKVLIPA